MSSLFGSKDGEYKKAEDIDLTGTEAEINKATNIDDPKNAIDQERKGLGEGEPTTTKKV